MTTVPPDAVAATARFVLLQHLPMLVVDLQAPPDDDPAAPLVRPDGLGEALASRGMVVLPRFYDVDLPRGVRVGLTLEADGMRLEDDEETTLLRIGRHDVEPAWIERALALRGTMLCVGRGIGLRPEQTAHEVCDLLDIAATAQRVLGAIVGVAEPQQGLPLLFGG